jgi:hypothetical protein
VICQPQDDNRVANSPPTNLESDTPDRKLPTTATDRIELEPMSIRLCEGVTVTISDVAGTPPKELSWSWVINLSSVDRQCKLSWRGWPGRAPARPCKLPIPNQSIGAWIKTTEFSLRIRSLWLTSTSTSAQNPGRACFSGLLVVSNGPERNVKDTYQPSS